MNFSYESPHRNTNINTDVNLGFTPDIFPRGTHMCYIYNDDQERRKVMAQYVNTGIALGEFVGYFADLTSADLVDDYLASMGIQVPPDIPPEHWSFQPAKATYCPGHHFSPATMLGQLQAIYERCQTLGVSGVRATGEMSWALDAAIPGVDRLVEYEARINLLLETHPLTAVCQYDANRFDGATIFNILRVHPLMLVRGQVVHNPYYIPAREYLGSQGLPLEG